MQEGEYEGLKMRECNTVCCDLISSGGSVMILKL